MVRFGILGAGNIAHRFAASLAHEERAQLVAASCRTQEKAAAFLAEVPCAPDAQAYGDHNALLNDDNVDAVYLALPHAYHKDWAIRALHAGKAVLCEKPAMLTADEMREVAAVARETGELFMEAMKPRFVPLYAQVQEAVRAIGPLTFVDATLCNDMLGLVEGAGTYHMTPGPGAGVLLDCGTYCASWIAEFCPGAVLESVVGAQKNGVDVYVDARYTNGEMDARLECAFDRAKPRTATLVGKRGRIVVEDLHRPVRATLFLEGAEPQVLDAPYVVDDFFGEISHFVNLCEAGAPESPLMLLDDSVACAAVLDAVRPAFTVTPQALDVLNMQEHVLRYEDKFDADDAFELGAAIKSLAGDYDLGYVVRIVREADGYDLFCWGADGKRPANYDYAEKKRQAALRFGHCSLWAWTKAQLEGLSDEELFAQGDMPVGGAFPICVGEEHVATVCVSGLHEGRDHELIVRGLSKVLDVTVQPYPCVTV
ncbi:MAG: Gfo/Idh/MocA family oxidoreductase [Coriobacteriales bacterium]|nr:Gfo/Idh/MocA family oxidoreductase [Coriobacteriales bacterium]